MMQFPAANTFPQLQPPDAQTRRWAKGPIAQLDNRNNSKQYNTQARTFDSKRCPITLTMTVLIQQAMGLFAPRHFHC